MNYLVFKLLILFIALSSSMLSQNVNHTQFSYISVEEEAVVDRLNSGLAEDLARLPIGHSGKIAEIYHQRTNNLIEKIQGSHFIFNSSINTRIEKILDHILDQNTSIPKDKIRFFLSRYPWPNASCLGEGSMIFNIGLFRRLENDDQIAFIICHELAHYMENHVNSSIQNNLQAREELVSSQEFKELKKKEYGSYEAAQNILKEFTFDHKRHSRTHEKEADTIGMKYFVKTQYAITEAIRCLEILDKIDQEKYPSDLDIKNILDNPEYPFQLKWLREKSAGLSAMKTTTPEWDTDSLRTHPDCLDRIDLIKNTFLNKDLNQKNANATDIDANWQNDLLKADFEIVQSTFDFGDLGRCLFYSFQLLELFPENVYLRSMVGRCFYQIHQARKDHQLGEYVTFPSRQKKAYRKVLKFVYKLRLSEVKKLNYHFLHSADLSYRENEDYLFSLILATSLIENNHKELKQFINQYKKNFIDGKYVSSIELLDIE